MYLGIDGGVALLLLMYSGEISKNCESQIEMIVCKVVLELVTHLNIKSSKIFSFWWLKWKEERLGIFLPRGGIGGWVKAWCEWMVITEIATFHIICTANRHWIGQFGLYFLFGCFSILVYSNMTCKIWAYCCYIHKSYLPICQHCLHTLF